MNEEWKPLFQFDLLNIINDLCINEIRIGSPEHLIYEKMGKPELPTTKLTKKSKIFYHLYGNVTFLSENKTVIAIDIDFHSNKVNVASLNKTKNWSLKDWLVFAESKGWALDEISDVIRILGNGVIISLSNTGKLGMVSIR